MTIPQPSPEKEDMFAAWQKKTKIGSYEIHDWKLLFGIFGLFVLFILFNVHSPQEVAAQKHKEQLELKHEEVPKKKSFQEALPELCTSQMYDIMGIRLYEFAEDAVTRRLKAPATAKFGGYLSAGSKVWLDKKTGNCMVKVISYVDAQNSFGANIRTKFSVLLRINKDESGTDIVEIVTL